MIAVVALLAVTVQFSTPPTPAQAAAVSCAGTVRIFDGRADGTMWYYEHKAPVTGDFAWVNGKWTASGFTGPTVASVNGTVYLVTASGELRRYAYNGTRWDGGGVVVGTGWQAWHANRSNPITADTKGRLYTIDATGALVMFDPTVPRWDATAGIPLALGWAGSRVVAAGDGVLYKIEPSGALWRYRYDADAQRFLSPSAQTGMGWQAFDKVFSPGGDVLYGILNGVLYWFRYDADTATWANNGYSKQVGVGWSGRLAVSATTGTCSIPAAPQVPAVTPVAADPAHAPELSGTGANFSYAYRDAQGRAVEARENGDALTRTVLGDKVFAGDLSSATSRDAAGTEQVLGVDASGSLWLAEGAAAFGGGWKPFGKGMRRAFLTEAVGPADPVQALAVDGAGTLWWRMRAAPHNKWLPWQQVATSVGALTAAASASGGAYGITGSNWFALERTGDVAKVTSGALPADFGSVVAAEVSTLPATLFARQAGTGAAVSWGPLPPLAVTTAPLSATQLGNGQVAVAAVGADGYAYVTTGSTDTGEYHPWQRVGVKAAGAVQVIAPDATSAHVAYLGQDGKLYHFAAAVTSGDTDPLVFNGKGR